jgi:hypothetical protein
VVPHTCDHSYSGDRGRRPKEKSYKDPISNNKANGVARLWSQLRRDHKEKDHGARLALAKCKKLSEK